MKHHPQRFVISDTHFNHEKILTFLRASGKKVRPHFNDVYEMNEGIVERWNKAVRPNDIVYHLGDVAMKRDLSLLPRLNGKKILILGNHDTCDLSEYAAHFEEVYPYLKLPKVGIMFSHMPIHIDCIKRRFINVHGHIHENIITEDTRLLEADFTQQHPKYFNACVEHHNFTPVHFDVLREYHDNSLN